MHKKKNSRRGLVTALVYENKSVPWVAYTEYCGVLLDRSKWERKMLLDNFTVKVFEDALSNWVINSAKGENYAYHYLQIEGWDDPDDLEKARKR